MFTAYLKILTSVQSFIGKMFNIFIGNEFNMRVMKGSGLDQGCVAHCLISLWKTFKWIFVAAKRRCLLQHHSFMARYWSNYWQSFNMNFRQVLGIEQGWVANCLISLWKNVKCIFVSAERRCLIQDIFYDCKRFDLYIGKILLWSFFKISGLEQNCVVKCLLRFWKNV